MTLEEVKERLDEVMDDSNLQLDEDIVIIRKKIDKGGDYSEVRINFSESQAKSFETTNERKDKQVLSLTHIELFGWYWNMNFNY